MHCLKSIHILFILFSRNSPHSDCHRSNTYLFVRGFRSEKGRSSSEMSPSRASLAAAEFPLMPTWPGTQIELQLQHFVAASTDLQLQAVTVSLLTLQNLNKNNKQTMEGSFVATKATSLRQNCNHQYSLLTLVEATLYYHNRSAQSDRFRHQTTS